jgi:hypothetical protein
MMNLIYFETSMTVSWNLFRFDKQRGSPYFPLAIGGLEKCQAYTPMFQGNAARLNGRNWVFNLMDLDEQIALIGDISHRYKLVNSNVYSLTKNVLNKVFFQRDIIKDHDH